MITHADIEKILDTYSFEEVLELNDLTEVDVLYFLVRSGQAILPDPAPVDL